MCPNFDWYCRSPWKSPNCATKQTAVVNHHPQFIGPPLTMEWLWNHRHDWGLYRRRERETSHHRDSEQTGFIFNFCLSLTSLHLTLVSLQTKPLDVKRHSHAIFLSITKTCTVIKFSLILFVCVNMASGKVTQLFQILIWTVMLNNSII